jgi:Ca2+-binding RTX toxin-like protein
MATTKSVNITRKSQFPSTSSDGKVVEYSISLSAVPEKNVTIQFTSSDTTEGRVTTPSLTFTLQNWNAPQVLRVQGVSEECNDDGNVAYSVTGKIVSEDAAYKKAVVPVTNLTNVSYGLDMNDYFRSTPEVDYLQGKSCNDRIYGGFGNDMIKGGGGNDRLHGQEDNDRLFGELGGDKLYGGLGDDTLDGGADNDFLFGEQGLDTLLGGAGNDYLDGGIENDSMVGGAGNDTYLVDSAGDKINDLGAVTDIDTVQVIKAISYTLPANIENAAITANGSGNLTGNALNNGLTGNDGKNILYGGAGNDTLAGCFFGANGGRSEIDTLVGGIGNDIFQLGWSSGRFYDDGNAKNAGRTDYVLITDFTVGQDKLQLDGAASGYYLAASGVSGVTGTGLYAEQGATDELIAIIRSANSTALNVTNTVNTALFV